MLYLKSNIFLLEPLLADLIPKPCLEITINRQNVQYQGHIPYPLKRKTYKRCIREVRSNERRAKRKETIACT